MGKHLEERASLLILGVLRRRAWIPISYTYRELMSLGGETFNASLGTLRDRLAGNRIGV
jgi:hypothetical protein